MQINTLSRAELKTYFVRNAIPTENNFADLINGMLNFKDDGIVKQADSPLSLQAAGTNQTSEKPAIHFYQDFNSNTADWVFNLNPFSTPNNPATARPGFNIADGGGASRLFIDKSTGNIGIGTVAPVERLHINGNLRGNQTGGAVRINTDFGWVDVGPKNAEGSHFYTDRARFYFNTEIRVDSGKIGSYNDDLSLQTGNDVRLTINQGNGNVGIGINNPAEKLDINGRIKTGALTFGPWPANGNYVFFGTNVLDQTQGGNYALLQGSSGSELGRTFLNSPVDIHFRIKNSEKMALDANGNLNVYSAVSFGSATRQMLNLWGTGYGIGVQGSTMYFRSNTHFAWFMNGSHDDGTFNPGAGGKRLMALNSSGDLILSARTNPTNDPTKSPCRALVDNTDRLIINFGGDYANGVETSKDFIVRGNAYKPGGGSWGATSDLSLKKNVGSLNKALDKLLQLRGVTFEWKNPEKFNNATGIQMGLIAQEVETVFPEWVGPDPDGYKAITLRGFEALVIEALRELNAKIEALAMQPVHA